LLIISIFLTIDISAQTSLSVSISADTIGLEDAIKVTYKLSGAQEKLEILPWEGLQQVAGPNVSSSFSFVNGVSYKEYSESYILVPKYEGIIYIPSASVVIDGEPIETEPIELFVVAEPTYQKNKSLERKSIKKSPTQKSKLDDEAEYQRLLKKRELAKKKKKF
ncbi:BatD family protein, partial [Saprospiraceae bacterium]|nr:BatD family protein [Saprospiraceae bacterium]